jgi:hypothetical protein
MTVGTSLYLTHVCDLLFVKAAGELEIRRGDGHGRRVLAVRD